MIFNSNKFSLRNRCFIYFIETRAYSSFGTQKIYNCHENSDKREKRAVQNKVCSSIVCSQSRVLLLKVSKSYHTCIISHREKTGNLQEERDILCEC